MSTLKVDAIVDSSAGNTTTINGATPSVYNTMGKNRIINGAMEIDQRNAGSSVNNTNGNLYTLDRLNTFGSQASKFSVQQSTTAPAGFTNSAKITSLSAYTVGASEIFRLQQIIEGFNCSDLAWGTANAKTVTLSFWVRSSLTGTFGGSLVMGPSGGLAYPYSYTINSADTWEQKSITISGPTTGTWSGTGNGNFVQLNFGLGVGSTYSGTAGAWSAVANYNSVTGATSVVGTSGATFYITGVQLEVGSVATEFERRPFGIEFALCQRYYEMAQDYPGYSSNVRWNGSTDAYSNFTCQTRYAVQKRATPTQYYFKTDGTSGVFAVAGNGISGDRTPALWNQNGAQFSFYVAFGSGYNWGSGTVEGRWIADAEL